MVEYFGRRRKPIRKFFCPFPIPRSSRIFKSGLRTGDRCKLTEAKPFDNRFGPFFNHIDHFTRHDFLFITSGGVELANKAAKPEESQSGGDLKQALAAVESDAEENQVNDGEEDG